MSSTENHLQHISLSTLLKKEQSHFKWLNFVPNKRLARERTQETKHRGKYFFFSWYFSKIRCQSITFSVLYIYAKKNLKFSAHTWGFFELDEEVAAAETA